MSGSSLPGPARSGAPEVVEMLMKLLAQSEREAVVLILDAQENVTDWKVMPLSDVTSILLTSPRLPHTRSAWEL
jgi:hypothetical protein